MLPAQGHANSGERALEPLPLPNVFALNPPPQDGFNIFDALVVTISLLEIVLSSVAGLSAVRALRVLKALRVLRLFKLFRYMQSLRRIGEVLLSAFSSFAAIAMLLFLFWLVFSIVGLHTFGAKDLQYYPWPNYSTFLYRWGMGGLNGAVRTASCRTGVGCTRCT